MTSLTIPLIEPGAKSNFFLYDDKINLT